MLEKFPNLKLQIVGKGKIKSELVSLARSLNIQKSVQFTGEKKGKEIIKHYKSSHLLLLPSLYEGQPLVLLEAWASHLTPVATKTGDIPYLIKDSVSGFLIKGTGPKDITSAVLRALKADLNTTAQNGYNFVKENYTWENAAKQTKKVYESLIKAGD